MSRTRPSTLTLAALALLLGGCAHAAAAPIGAPPPAAPSSAVACTTLPAPARITDADSGRTFCLAVGDQLNVFLTSTPERRWQPVTADGTALAGRPSGIGALAIGVTGGFFRAAAAGTAHLTSSRLACVDPGPNCGSATFDVTVVVR